MINPFGFLISPLSQWQKIAQINDDKFGAFISYPLIMALLPCVAWYYGTAISGWTIGENHDTVRLTSDSALKLIIAFYLTMVVSIGVIGYAIAWMGKTYGLHTTVMKGIAVSAFASTPMFIIGLTGFYPIMWLDLSLGIFALCWSVYLLYMGIPVAMKISKEQGFLYTSAIIAVCCVILMCIMGGSVILWDNGFMPVFTD